VKRYYITDSLSLPAGESLIETIVRNERAGVDLIQIREKHLEARALALLVREAVAVCKNAQILVSSRVDVALACGAAGVHLPAGSIPPLAWRNIVPPGFLIGVSCHNLAEIKASAGADFVVYGPVFAPLSKVDPRQPVGLSGLRQACSMAPVAIFALGGITAQNAAECIAAGAAGVAGITLFQRPGSRA